MFFIAVRCDLRCVRRVAAASSTARDRHCRFSDIVSVNDDVDNSSARDASVEFVATRCAVSGNVSERNDVNNANADDADDANDDGDDGNDDDDDTIDVVFDSSVALCDALVARIARFAVNIIFFQLCVVYI